MYIVLLGDSIFDNAAYVAGGPDVRVQVQARLRQEQNGRVALLAVDGSMVADVPAQLARIPREATHLIVSAGGNDALSHVTLLNENVRSVAEAVERIATIGEAYARNYRQMVDEVLRLNLPTALCTIYYPRFPDPILQRAALTALAVFNDCIIREAIQRGLPLLDLRMICDDDGDYANPIEPSVRGGEKIAAAIVRLVADHDFSLRQTVIFTR